MDDITADFNLDLNIPFARDKILSRYRKFQKSLPVALKPLIQKLLSRSIPSSHLRRMKSSEASDSE